MSESTFASEFEDEPIEGKRIEYDSTVGAYRAQYDWSIVAPSTAVLESVSSLRGVDPTDLDPLYGFVDPEGLDALFVPDARASDTSVTFGFQNDTITVHGDGTITISPPDEKSV